MCVCVCVRACVCVCVCVCVQGYDVFLGNFRGIASLGRTGRGGGGGEGYWDYTLDDHADRDVAAFVDEAPNPQCNA